MLKKLSKLGDVLAQKESGILNYQIVIDYLPLLSHTPEAATVEIEVMTTAGVFRRYKLGKITEQFDMVQYLNECLEDLAKER